ncbi:MAG: hypothetical protein IKG63_06600 [Streptococcus sp.]|nr:hypothetical protein [Streptococcus sp.]
MRIYSKENENKKREALWGEFIKSDKRYISAITSRRTGKTCAMIDRVIKRQYDTVILEGYSHQLDLLLRVIQEKLEESEVTCTVLLNENNHKKIKAGDQLITLITPSYKGDVHTSSTVDWIFEEPEYYEEEVIKIMKDLDQDYLTLTMIGTLKSKNFNYIKGYHFYAMAKGYATTIGAQNLIEEGLMKEKDLQEFKKNMSEESFALEMLSDF